MTLASVKCMVLFHSFKQHGWNHVSKGKNEEWMLSVIDVDCILLVTFGDKDAFVEECWLNEFEYYLIVTVFCILILFCLGSICIRVAIIKSDKDTRYGLESIVTHDGEKFPCWPLSDLSSLKQKIGLDVYDKVSQCWHLQFCTMYE